MADIYNKSFHERELFFVCNKSFFFSTFKASSRRNRWKDFHPFNWWMKSLKWNESIWNVKLSKVQSSPALLFRPRILNTRKHQSLKNAFRKKEKSSTINNLWNVQIFSIVKNWFECAHVATWERDQLLTLCIFRLAFEKKEAGEEKKI